MTTTWSKQEFNGRQLELDRALNLFNDFYDLYYSADDSGKPINYDNDVDLFDELRKDYDFCQMTCEFMDFRGDLIVSDREAAAYIAALRRMYMLPDEYAERAAVVVPTVCAVDYTDYEAAAGNAVTGNGWIVEFSKTLNKTIVTIINDPTGAIKDEVERAGFWYSPTFKTYNKKFTRKAHRAALELIKELNRLAA